MDHILFQKTSQKDELKNKDPFDRMLAWQAICSDYYLLTQDQDFADYQGHGLKIV